MYGDQFALWCRKLNHLTDDQFRRGMERVEYNVREAAKLGEKSWPPNYLEFSGYCERLPGEQAWRRYARRLPEPKSLRQKRRERGMAECAKILEDLQ